MIDDQNGSLSIIDLRNYDEFWIEFQKPNDDANVLKAFTDANPVDFFTDGSDGIMKWDDDVDGVDSLLDVSGTWRRRGIIGVAATGAKWTGSWIEFEVEE
jgi:hypothetical protein